MQIIVPNTLVSLPGLHRNKYCLGCFELGAVVCTSSGSTASRRAAHSPLTDLMQATKVSTITEKGSKECVGKGMCGNSFLCSPESAPCVFFVVNTICSEGSFIALCHHVNGYGVSKCHDTVTN